MAEFANARMFHAKEGSDEVSSRSHARFKLRLEEERLGDFREVQP
jgi:hypothetical protein